MDKTSSIPAATGKVASIDRSISHHRHNQRQRQGYERRQPRMQRMVDKFTMAVSKHTYIVEPLLSKFH